MDGDNIDARFSQRFQGFSQFALGDREVPINHRILITTGKCRPGIDAHTAIDGNAVHFRRAPEGEFDHALIHLTADMKILLSGSAVIVLTSGNAGLRKESAGVR